MPTNWERNLWPSTLSIGSFFFFFPGYQNLQSNLKQQEEKSGKDLIFQGSNVTHLAWNISWQVLTRGSGTKSHVLKKDILASFSVTKSIS